MMIPKHSRWLAIGGLLFFLALALQSIAPIVAQGNMVSVTVVDVEHTVTLHASGARQLQDVARYYIAEDGAYRIDTRRGDVRTGEIVDLKAGKRIALNFDTREAIVRNANASMFVLPPSSEPQQVPAGIPSVWKEESRDKVDLGTSYFEGLPLKGTRSTYNFSRGGLALRQVVEMWVYHAPDPRNVPLPIQVRFEMPDRTDERRITSVSLDVMPKETFQVPADFKIVSR